jgi:hypothetical protein
MTKDDLRGYSNIAIIEKGMQHPLGIRKYKYLGENRPFNETTDGRMADLVLELRAGELHIIKNRYGRPGGIFYLPDDEMAKLLLTH